MASAAPPPSTVDLITQVCSLPAPPADIIATLSMLQKVFFNVLGHPDELKYRALRRSNPAVARAIVAVPGAAALLAAFGFVVEGDAFVLPPGAVPDEGVAAMVTEALAAVEDAAAAEAAAARRAGGAEALKKKEAERVERERLAALARRDQAERKAAEADRRVGESRACERAFGSRTTTFKDVGVDLNKRGGGCG